MLQNFRDNLHGAAKGVLIAIIIVPFALFGVDAIFLSGNAVEEVANVNGESITELRLQQAVALQKQQILNRYENIDPSMVDESQLRAPVVQQLIRQKVVEQAAVDQGMGVDKKTIYRMLLEVPDFQADGKFDTERYEFVLRQMGYSPSSYNKLLTTDMVTSQFMQGVATTGFSTEPESKLLAGMTEQTRDYYYLTIPRAPLMESVSVPSADIRTYYEANQDEFVSEEQLVVEYVELRPSDLVEDVDVEQGMVDEIVDAKIAAAASARSRRVAQILIERQDDQSHLKKIAEIEAKLQAGEEFSALASEYSEDYGTAEQGGDLGFIPAGDLPEPLGLELDKLAVGEVSGIVESELGVHLLKLLDEKAADVPSRESLEPSVRQELTRQLAMELLPERIEELKDLSYNADSLGSVAGRLGLELQVSQPFSRQKGQGVTANPLVVRAAYSKPVLDDGIASEVLELADDHVLVLALKERIPASLRPLAEVRENIETTLKQQLVSRQLMAHGEALAGWVKSGDTIEEVAKEESLAWQVSLDTKRFTGNQNDEIRQKVFAMDEPAGQPVVDSLVLENGDYVLISLVKVKEGDFSQLSRDQQKLLTATIALTAASRDYQAYEKLLLESADVASKY
ncbi:SurA N-terminal domain-containing protein [Porticoccus sp.]